MTEGRKDDEDKLRYDLIPPEALAGLAAVFTMGAKKYDDRNWEKGIAYGRLYAALLRHLEAWRRGEDRDTENGQHHLDSVVWNAAALRAYEEWGYGPTWDNLRRRYVNYGTNCICNQETFCRDGGKVSAVR